MFDYFRDEVGKSTGSGAEYLDVFSGRVFSETLEALGGEEAVRNDIFLILSGDGGQSYRSWTYDFWPFVVLIAYFPPSDCVAFDNMLPIMCIPGPCEPVDLVSLLK